MGKKKLMSFAVALAMICQLFCGMAVTANAAAYDALGSYTNASTTVKGRYSTMTMAQIGSKMYAYAGVNTASSGTGGLHVLDVTNPKTPQLVQEVPGTQIKFPDSSWSGEKIIVKDGYLMVCDTNDQALEVYLIDTENGTIGEAPSLQLKNNLQNQTMKLVGNYLFVSGQRAKNPCMVIYDVTDPADSKLLSTTTPLYPNMTSADTDTEQIAIFNFAVRKLENNTYRIAAINRSKPDGTNSYYITVRDIVINGSSYTATDDSFFGTANSEWSSNFATEYLRDIEFIDQNTLAVVYNGSARNSIPTLDIIDITDVAKPVKKVSSTETARGISGVITDDGEVIVGTEDSVAYVYTYKDDTLTKKKSFTTSGQGYEIGIYSGFLYSASSGSVDLYEYSNDISITSDSVDKINGSVTGVAEGFLPDTHSVSVTIGDTTVEATVTGNIFTAKAPDALQGETVEVTAKLMEGTTEIAAATKTLPVKTISSRKYFDINEMTVKGTASNTVTSTRVTGAVGVTVGEKKYAYAYATTDTANVEGAILVYDITDEDNITLIQTVSGVYSKIYTEQIVAVDGYIAVSAKKIDGTTMTFDVDFYKIGDDGKLVSSPAQSIDLGGVAQTATLEIADNYLFVSMQGTTGRQIRVYDISNIEKEITLLGATETDNGAYATAVMKISDSLYRTCYINRSEANGWQFCVNDMSVAEDGEITFTQKYIDTNGSFSNISAISDIEFLDTNKVYVSFGNGDYGAVVDLSTVSAPTITTETSKTNCALNINDELYALGYPDGTVKIYRKSDDSQLKSISVGGQIYDLILYDGDILVATENKIAVYGDLYTGITLDKTAIVSDGTAVITGHVDGYETGDSVQLIIGGSTVDATVNVAGNYSYEYEVEENGTVSVIAVLNKNDDTVLSVTENITFKTEEKSKFPYFEVVSADKDANGYVVVTIKQLSTYTGTAKAYVATYSDSGTRFDNCNIGTISVKADGTATIETTLTYDPQTQVLKVFVLDKDFSPLAEVGTPVIAEASQVF